MKRNASVTSIAGVGVLTLALAALGQQNPPSEPRPQQPQPQQPGARPGQPGQQPGQQPGERPGMRPGSGAQSSHMDTPRDAQALDTQLTENTIQLCADENFKGKQVTISGLNDKHRAGTLNEVGTDLNDDLTSLRWNLEPGIAVVFYNDGEGKGDQLVIWGKGQYPTLDKCKFDDKAARWAWYDLGGAGDRSASGAALPHGAQPIAGTLPEGTLQFFDENDFKNEMQQVTGITSQKAGELHMLPGKMENSVSSMKWSLPEGVIVLLSKNDDGTETIGLWGKGQVADLGDWDFNNAASRWTWAHIGAANGNNGGMRPTPNRPEQPGMRPNPNNPNNPNSPNGPATVQP